MTLFSIKVLQRLAYAFIKLAFKLAIVFTVLAFIFNIQFALGATVILMGVLFLLFLNNLFSVPTENAKYSKRSRPGDDDEHWTPGQPAVTPKAYGMGFFYKIHEPDDE
jgi:hypothetical protein